MTLHRLVNGEQVELTPEEEEAFNAAQAAHDAGILNRIKAAKNAEINAAREVANLTFPYSGKVFDSDAESQTYIVGVNSQVTRLKAMPPGWIGYWKTADNERHSITTVAQWNAFYDAMFAQGMTNFGKSEQLKADLAAATTEEEIAAISWTTL